MSEFFMGEIRLFAMSYAPKGWAVCNGASLNVGQNQALFSLLGTFYGGDGVNTFKLPDLRGKVPIGVGSGGSQPAVVLGQQSGEELHTLTINELPQHVHSLGVNASQSAANNSSSPSAGNTLGQSGGFSDNGNIPISVYNSSLSSTVQVAQAMIGNNGGSGPHENRQPYLPLNYCIALTGIYPSRN